MTNTQELEFDIALATRNRQQVLGLSIPLMLAQNRLPRRFIVVDSSDDHSAARRVVEDVFSREGDVGTTDRFWSLRKRGVSTSATWDCNTWHHRS